MLYAILFDVLICVCACFVSLFCKPFNNAKILAVLHVYVFFFNFAMLRMMKTRTHAPIPNEQLMIARW